MTEDNVGWLKGWEDLKKKKNYNQFTELTNLHNLLFFGEGDPPGALPAAMNLYV